jgi:O-antigen ligase
MTLPPVHPVGPSPLAWRIFLGYAVASLSFIGLAIATEWYWLAGIPVLFWVLGQAIMDFRVFFWLLLTMIPVSTVIFLPGGLSTDLPTEPLAIGLTGIFIVHALKHWPGYESKTFGHPIALLLYLHVGWILVSTLFSPGLLVSLKFSLAKLWYVGAYFLVPLLVLKTPRHVRLFAHCIFWPLLFVAVQTLVRHAAFGFSFAMQHKTMHPFMSEHVSYAGCLATFTPWLVYLGWSRLNRGKSIWWLASIIGPLWLAAVYFSYTRAAFVALALAAGAYFIVRWRLMKPALFAAMMVALGAAVYLLNDNKYLDYAPNYDTTITHERFDNLISATYKLEDISTMERFYRWIAAGHMIPYRPITGWGPGNFVEFYRGYTVNAFRTYVSENPEGSGIHSYYLMTLVEQGFPGLLIFLVYIFGLLIIGERIYHRVQDPATRNAVMAAILAMLIINAFNIINDQMETDKIGAQFLLNASILIVMDRYSANQGQRHPEASNAT